MRAFFPFLLFFVMPLLGAGQDWQTDFDTALALAQKEQKSLVLVFSGSDWCAPCIKLDREIWQSEAFQEHAQENYILYRADFPRKKANQLPKETQHQNAQLADRYNPRGQFPLVLVLDNQAAIQGATGYAQVSPQAYIAQLDAFVQ